MMVCADVISSVCECVHVPGCVCMCLSVCAHAWVCATYHWPLNSVNQQMQQQQTSRLPQDVGDINVVDFSGGSVTSPDVCYRERTTCV